MVFKKCIYWYKWQLSGVYQINYSKHTNNLILPQRNVFNSDNCISCHLICLPWKKLICWWLSKSLHGLKCSEKVVESKLEGLVRTRAEERQPLHKLLHHSPGGRIDDQLLTSAPYGFSVRCPESVASLVQKCWETLSEKNHRQCSVWNVSDRQGVKRD